MRSSPTGGAAENKFKKRLYKMRLAGYDLVVSGTNGPQAKPKEAPMFKLTVGTKIVGIAANAKYAAKMAEVKGAVVAAMTAEEVAAYVAGGAAAVEALR